MSSVTSGAYPLSIKVWMNRKAFVRNKERMTVRVNCVSKLELFVLC